MLDVRVEMGNIDRGGFQTNKAFAVINDGREQCPMASLVQVTEDNFKAVVLKSELPVVADFSAEWCMPCKRLAPVLEELAEYYAGRVVIAHIDVDKASSLTRQYRVRSVPTLLFVKGGRVVDTSAGLVSKAQLAQKIEAMLS